MTDRPELTDLLGRITFLLSEEINFTATDSATTGRKVELLVAAAKYFNMLAVTDFGGRIGQARSEGLVE